MRLEDFTLDALRRAIDLYLETAYPAGAPRRPLPLRIEGAQSVRELLPQFLDESKPSGAHRYALRLGNARYPFMKLVLQENLLEDEYTLCADTHDQIEVKSSAPDYKEWLEVRAYNARIKQAIEDRWTEAGLPSPAALKDAIERWLRDHPRPHLPGRGERIVVVDDEKEVADALRIFLEAEGYQVEAYYDGLEAMEAIGRSLPNLILLDYDLPQLDGMRVCREVREGADAQRVPILLTTASNVDLSLTDVASGFLAKPFKLDLLSEFVRHLLPTEGFGPPPGG